MLVNFFFQTTVIVIVLSINADKQKAVEPWCDAMEAQYIKWIKAEL